MGHILKGLAAASPQYLVEDWKKLNMHDEASVMVWSPWPLEIWNQPGKVDIMWWGDKLPVIQFWRKIVPHDYAGRFFELNEAEGDDERDSAHMTPREAAKWHCTLAQEHPLATVITPNTTFRDIMHTGYVHPATGLFTFIPEGERVEMPADAFLPEREVVGRRCPWTVSFVDELWLFWDYAEANPGKELVRPFKNWTHLGFHWYDNPHQEAYMTPSWAYEELWKAVSVSSTGRILKTKRPGIVGEMNARNNPNLLGEWMQDCIDHGLAFNVFTNRHDELRKEHWALVGENGKLTANGKVFAEF